MAEDVVCELFVADFEHLFDQRGEFVRGFAQSDEIDFVGDDSGEIWTEFSNVGSPVWGLPWSGCVAKIVDIERAITKKGRTCILDTNCSSKQ